MPMDFANLDAATRGFMMKEVGLDIARNKLYLSGRLNVLGRDEYPNLLRMAIKAYDDAWLADQLRERRSLASIGDRKGQPVRIPVTAADTLAESEFNRFYIRGLSARAAHEGIEDVEIYRAKTVAQPRPESVQLIGRRINAVELLTALRNAPGSRPALGLALRPNSGLSVRLP